MSGTLIMLLMRTFINIKMTLDEAVRVFDSMLGFKRYLTPASIVPMAADAKRSSVPVAKLRERDTDSGRS